LRPLNGMRKLLLYFLVFITVFYAGPQREREAHAIIPVVAALTPEAAVVVLLAGIAAATAAAEIGVITYQRRDEISAALQSKIDIIQDHVKRGLRMSEESLKDMVVLAIEAQNLLSGKTVCDKLFKRASGGAGHVGGNVAKTQRAREQSEGECDPSLRGSPYECCPDFMNKFGRSHMTPIGNGAFRMFYYGYHASTHSCCFEWDSLHGRFEVYEQSNHGGSKHRGEKSCAEAENLDEDLCTANKMEKADLLSDRHSPRNGCP